ncbi:MAG: hypothetical protein K0Q59_3295 [Paenibacillus sp.]|jgi:hypothetical protein|nr:hypothetical protein [Paenibacillus sp.]
MEPKLNCAIVQDLLPSYIERLTGELTNKAVEEHLSVCSDCRNAMEAMTKHTVIGTPVPPKQINFLKKIKRRQWKVAGGSVAAIVLLLLGTYYFFVPRSISVPVNAVTIGDVYRLSDGAIHYRIKANVENYVNHFSSHSDGQTEIVRMFEQKRFTSSRSKDNVSESEQWSSATTAIYYEGTSKKDRFVIWQSGMSIPQATAEQEARYQANMRRR